MKIKRLSTSETVSLEDGFLWLDEFEWKAKEQNQSRAVNGALIIQEGNKLAGRTITLGADDQGMGWVSRADLKTLLEWTALPKSDYLELEFEYPHDTRKFNVMFDHTSNPIEAKPIKGHPTVSDDEFYKATLRLIEVPNGN